MKFDFVSGLKKGIEAIKIVKTILRAVDKIDDDLDGDGKASCEYRESLNEARPPGSQLRQRSSSPESR